MTTIWKFPLTATVGMPEKIAMPAGATILDVQVQSGQPCMWAEVDPAAPVEDRMFVVRGTGHTFDGFHGTYIKTFQEPPYVWHLYEL